MPKVAEEKNAIETLKATQLAIFPSPGDSQLLNTLYRGMPNESYPPHLTEAVKEYQNLLDSTPYLILYDVVLNTVCTKLEQEDFISTFSVFFQEMGLQNFRSIFADQFLGNASQPGQWDMGQIMKEVLPDFVAATALPGPENDPDLDDAQRILARLDLGKQFFLACDLLSVDWYLTPIGKNIVSKSTSLRSALADGFEFLRLPKPIVEQHLTDALPEDKDSLFDWTLFQPPAELILSFFQGLNLSDLKSAIGNRREYRCFIFQLVEAANHGDMFQLADNDEDNWISLIATLMSGAAIPLDSPRGTPYRELTTQDQETYQYWQSHNTGILYSYLYQDVYDPARETRIVIKLLDQLCQDDENILSLSAILNLPNPGLWTRVFQEAHADPKTNSLALRLVEKFVTASETSALMPMGEHARTAFSAALAHPPR